MPKVLAAMLLVTCFAAANSNAEENKLVVVGGVDFAFKSLSLDVGSGQKLTVPLSTVRPNLALSYGDFYSSLSYDGAVAPGTMTMVVSGLPAVLDMSRSDFSLTVGYRLADSINIFGGWLNGDIHAVQSGYRNSGSGDEWYVQNIRYGTQGPFLGASWSRAIGKRSSLGFSAAYAKLAGTLVENINFSGGTSNSSSSSFDVAGLSYGITVSGELTGSLGYRVGIKNTRYEGGSAGNEGGEEYTSFFFGVSNYF